MQISARYLALRLGDCWSAIDADSYDGTEDDPHRGRDPAEIKAAIATQLGALNARP